LILSTLAFDPFAEEVTETWAAQPGNTTNRYLVLRCKDGYLKRLQELHIRPSWGWPRTRCIVTQELPGRKRRTNVFFRGYYTNCGTISCPRTLPKPDAAKKEEVQFVFQTVRHGARAPEALEGGREFPVPYKMVTPMGIRQRYLLGRYMATKVNNSFDIA
jgi:hypothetical protein